MNTAPAGGAAKPDPAVVAIGRTLERTVRKVDQLDNGLRTLADTVASLGSGAAAKTDAGLPSWLLTDDPDAAAEAALDLTVWLQEVYLHYPDSALSACWLWHPAVVEELWWLRCAHADAYGAESGSWLRVGDWHDRQRPGVVRRVRAVLAKCDLSRHAPRRGQPAEVAVMRLPPPLASAAVAIAVAWTTDRDLPEPTTDQLSDAETHNREHLWKHR